MNLTFGRRFFERLQQCVEGVLRQHMHFVDDVDLVARRYRPVAHPLGQVADVVDPGARGGVHLDDVDMAVLGDRAAMDALAARRNGRAAIAVGADAVKGAGDDPRRRRLADPAHPGQDEGVRDPPGRNRVRQGAHHRLLADDLGEGLRPVLAGEDAIGGRGIGHWLAAGLGRRWRWETEQTTQTANSLRLLPSGPDRVGEGPVRRRPPTALYQAPAPARQVSGPRTA